MAVECQIDMSLLPPDFCAGTPQEFANAIAAAMKVTLPLTASTVNTGSSTPADRNSPWLRFGSNDAKAPDGLYFFQGGFWCLAHPIQPGSLLFQFVYLQRANIPTYDGGTEGAVGLYSGPMWQIATEMDGRVPVGANGISGSRFENAGNAGGAEEITLTVAQLPQHNHRHWDTMVRERVESGEIRDISKVTEAASCKIAADNSGYGIGKSDDDNITCGNMRNTLTTGNTEAHENMPPYRTGCWIKRTARKFYTIAP